MSNLYLWLDIAVIIFPFILSFDKKVHYVSVWKTVFGAMCCIGIPFLIHDYFFTKMAIWGFNEAYLTGYYALNLPIEEVLFFVVVPFSCTFIYVCCQSYFPNHHFRRFNQLFYALIALYAIVVLCLGFGRWYSTMVALVALLFLAMLLNSRHSYTHLPIAVAISMIPFFLMNSILTGSCTPEPIVWYDNLENLGFRWGTIPVEDLLYSFILVAGNIVAFERLLNKQLTKG